MRALVLGCGPAGLMAAHALTLDGHDVIVVSKKRKSEMYGAQYLHMPIPGMTDKPGVEISYTLQGTAMEYRRKVYGDGSLAKGQKVSVDELTGSHMGWDIRSTYDNLWDRYGDDVQHEEDIDATYVRVAMEALKPDVVFCTIPGHAICEDLETHSFIYEEVYAIGDAPERGIFCPVIVEPNTVVCNGEPAPAWYRAANVFSRKTAEWPVQSKPPISNVTLIQKPLRTTCTCLPDVVRLGRFGKWQKGILSHEAFVGARAYASSRGTQTVLFP